MYETQLNNIDQSCLTRKVYLIGTQLTLKQLLVGFEVLSENVKPVGILIARTLKRSMDDGMVNVGSLPQDLDCACNYLDDSLLLPKQINQIDADEIWVSLPELYWQRYRTLKQLLDARIIPWRQVQPLDQWLNMGTHANRNLLHFNAVDPVSVLNRAPKSLNRESISGILENQSVLITGAGGSIGSEIAWRAMDFNPRQLILVERSENALFEIDRQLRQVASEREVLIETVLHDVTDSRGTNQLLANQKPDVIYHAAAHKHVPMMEGHPSAALENNLYGTRSIADAAVANHVKRFVMISTDKAVNPTSVMGATKRLAEKYIQWLAMKNSTHFCMVRFGNVLGSACSVLPIWMRQLQSGGPITVTHPEMTRYFMSIPEAAGLVLQSSAYADQHKGGVFLLDMGSPIRILDMAQRFLSLQGLKVGVDVDLEITGPRPGEKMHEELSYQSESTAETGHPSIQVLANDDSIVTADHWVQSTMTDFDQLRQREGDHYLWGNVDRDEVLKALRTAIPEMQAPLRTVSRTLKTMKVA